MPQLVSQVGEHNSNHLGYLGFMVDIPTVYLSNIFHGGDVHQRSHHWRAIQPWGSPMVHLWVASCDGADVLKRWSCDPLIISQRQSTPMLNLCPWCPCSSRWKGERYLNMPEVNYEETSTLFQGQQCCIKNMYEGLWGCVLICSHHITYRNTVWWLHIMLRYNTYSSSVSRRAHHVHAIPFGGASMNLVAWSTRG